ncbi:hypothetical protein DYB28_015353, partial [Aphanomyces astaci]
VAMGNKASKGGGSSKGLRPGVHSESATGGLRPQPLPQTRQPNASAPAPHYRQQENKASAVLPPPVPNAVPVASTQVPVAAATSSNAAGKTAATEPDCTRELYQCIN